MEVDWSLSKCDGRTDLTWFPERTTTRQEIQRTKAVCRQCPIKRECLITAYKNGETVGIWGGALAQDIGRFAVLADISRNDPLEISVEKIALFVGSIQV